MEVASKVHAANLVRWSAGHPEVVVLSADLTGSTEIDLFREAYPDRFFSLGVAEQNMMSFAGGLAREGYIPFVHTFAVFIYRQALNQIVSSIAYSCLPVKMFGFLPGITTAGGATHQAIEDIAVMRSIPNMVVFETGDATEVETILDPVLESAGPVYVRMLRGEVPRLFDRRRPFAANRARLLGAGGDIALITAGICTEEAMRASAVLRARGVAVQHLHVSTHKPFTDQAILDGIAAARYGVITMENHTVIGGLGTAVAELMAENGIGRKLYRLGLQDTFAHGGSRPYLMKEYGLDAMAVVRKIEAILGTPLQVSESDLQGVRLEEAHGAAKAEAL